MQNNSKSFNSFLTEINKRLRNQAYQTQNRIICKHIETLCQLAVKDYKNNEINFMLLATAPAVLITKILYCSLQQNPEFVHKSIENINREDIWLKLISKTISSEEKQMNQAALGLIELGVQRIGFSKNRVLNLIKNKIKEIEFSLTPEVSNLIEWIVDLIAQAKALENPMPSLRCYNCMFTAPPICPSNE